MLANVIQYSLKLIKKKYGKKNIEVGVIDKPPNVNSDHFVNAFDILLNDLFSENKSLFIMGDFNIDLLQYNGNNSTTLYQFTP